jgi:hypothetical protein
MASHWSLGHLQPRLWAKEGPRIKLIVWLLTTKSRESTSSQHPIWECNTALERSRRGVQFRFKPRCNRTLQSGVMNSQSPGTPTKTVSRQFRDSNLGVPGKSDIRAWVPRRVTEYIIGSKVVAYSRVRDVWIKWVQLHVACPNTQGCSQMLTNPLWLVFGCRFKFDLLVFLPSLIPGLQTRPSTPF